MKDGRIVQIGTPEEIVTQPADQYVSDFVEGISKLKLVFAHSIMEPFADSFPKASTICRRARVFIMERIWIA